jgi:VCBS repeat-containing protein
MQVDTPIVDITMTLTKPDGSPLTSLSLGQDFVLHVFGQDIRGAAAHGVFALYTDITFDGTKATITGPITYSSTYGSGHAGTTSTGLVGEGGAFAGTTETGANPVEVFSVPMRAAAAGSITFATDPAEIQPQHAILEYNPGTDASGSTPIPPKQVHYGSASIQVSSTFNAVNDTFTAAEDSQNNTINPLANDTSIGGATNTLTISGVGTTDHGGTVTISSDNKTLKYTPAALFVGTETFTYTATNQNNETHTATITMNVTGINHPPTANNDTFNLAKNSTANPLDVLANDTTTPDTGETLRITAVGTGNHGGTITIGTNGANILYTPAANFTGAETFTYTISDRAAGVSGGLTSQATVTVNVGGLVANNDAFTVLMNAAAADFNVLANDTLDANVGGTLTITAVGTTDHGGTVSISQSGTRINYAPASGFKGLEKFTYTIGDGHGNSATGTVTMTVNGPPTAANDTVSAFKNTAATLDVLANDTSGTTPASAMTIDSASLTQPSHGTVAVSSDGTKVIYTPATDYTGADSFTYKAKGPDGQISAAATANVTVQEFVPSVLSGFVYFDTNNNGTKDANEIGLVGITITLTGTATAGSNTTANGINLTAKTAEDGSYKFDTLAPGTYTIKETQPLFVIDGKVTAGSQGGTTGTNQITIANMAQATAGTNNNFGEMGRALTTISLRDFFSSTSKNYAYAAFDNSGAELWHATTGAVWQGYNKNAFSLINSQTQIQIDSTNAQSLVTTKKLDTSLPVFQAGSSGTNTFYYVPGGPGGNATNQPPTGVADTYTTTLNTALTQNAANGVLKNDTDPEGKTLTAGKVSDPAHGSVTLNSDGSFTYTPSTGFTGTDTFTYKASDGTKQSAVTTVTIAVNPANATPTAVADSYTVNEDNILSVTSANSVLKNDTGTNLTAVKVTDPTKGSVNFSSDGTFTYTPTANANGTDTFTYKAVSGSAESAPVTVTINITPQNDPPSAIDHSYTAIKNTAFTPPSGNTLLTGATDVDNDTLTAATAAVTGPSHGQLTINSNGTFTYTPATDFAGTDTFTFKVNDSHVDSAPATVTITVNPPANHAPVAANDTLTVDEDSSATVGVETGVLSNDTDSDTGDQAVLTAQQVTGPSNGTLTLHSDGSYTYQPNANFHGTDTFTYQANDGHSTSNLSNIATVTITVTAINDPPVGVADSYRVNPGDNLSVNAANGVLSNDTDIDTPLQNLTATIVTQPAHGTVVLNLDGSFTYTPKDDGFAGGPDPFTYTVSDNESPTPGISQATTVTIVVDTPPHAHNQSFTTAEDTPLSVPAASGLLFHDFDDEGDPMTALIVNQPANGTVTLNPNGAFTYTPHANFFGTDTFRYQATDGIVASSPATITITVTSVNDLPVANPDGYSVNAGEEIVIPASSGVLHNDTDAENETLTAAVVSQPSHGTLVFNANGDGGFTYTADADFHGDDTFTYKANDGHGDSNTATVTLHVNALPIATNDQAETDEDVVLTVDAAHSVLANDSDPDGTNLVAILIANAQHGNISLNSDGTFTYTPAPNFNGTDSFTYIASDGLGISNVATVTLTVHPVNDAPTGAADSFDVAQGGTLSVAAVDTVLKNDTDIDSPHSSLTAVNATTPANGSLDFHADGTFTYTPNPGFHGSDSFTYQPKDETDTGAATTVTIVVHETPQVTDDNYNVNQDGSLHTDSTNGVLANDISPEGRPIHAVLASTVGHGTLTLNQYGGFDYQPESGFTGTDSFTYLASDDVASSALATVTLNVQPAGGEGESASDLALLAYLSLHNNTNNPNQVPDGAWVSSVDQAMSQLG